MSVSLIPVYRLFLSLEKARLQRLSGRGILAKYGKNEEILDSIDEARHRFRIACLVG